MVTSRPQNSFVGAVDRYRQWLTEQVPTINAMTAYGNALFASTTANRLPRTTPNGMLFVRHDRAPALANGPSQTAVTITAVLTRGVAAAGSMSSPDGRLGFQRPGADSL
jgi:hypothetical protein